MESNPHPPAKRGSVGTEVTYCMRNRHTGRFIRVYTAEGPPGHAFKRYELCEDDLSLPIYTRASAAALVNLVVIDRATLVGTYKRPRMSTLTIRNLDDVEILKRRVVETFTPVPLTELATPAADQED